MDFLSSIEGDSATLQFIGFWTGKIYDERSMIQMYIHLILSALFPIYIGSYASLRCPPSAEDLAKKKGEKDSSSDDNDDDDEDELEEHTEFGGLTPSDAIMFPILAGLVLGGLYFLIKWLKDPAILNRILGYYFSALGIFGVGMLAGDSLNVATTFIFPKAWSSGKELYYVDPLLKQQFTDVPSIVGNHGVQLHRKFTEKTNPFPGRLSNLKLSDKAANQIWAVRSLLTDHWMLRAYVHGFISTKTKLRLNTVVGLMLGLSAIALYNFHGKAWWLTNLMGWGFCYNTLQFMSPTTFWTGTLVLSGLFIYDITMVFYTPLMITVATSLDVPIKLEFPGPGKGGMLGLGDIVLPGLMIALALRFDLYLFYLRQQTSTASNTSSKLDSLGSSTIPTSSPTTIIKPTYIPATATWGTAFWTRSFSKKELPEGLAAAHFPKPYFTASVVGYVVGMLATLTALTIFKHGQPALLYLVPGVLAAVWGTAVVRGEAKLMWVYSEGGMEEKGADGDKEGMKEIEDREEGKHNPDIRRNNKEKDNEHAHHVFLFSLSWPKHASRKAKLI